MARCASVSPDSSSPSYTPQPDQPPRMTFFNPNLGDKSLGRMFSCLEQGALCDVKLVASDGRKISAHKLVLTGGSDYFEAMFTGALQEAHQDVVHMEQIDGDILQSLVTYCYTGKISIVGDNALAILETANYLLIPEVVESCFHFLPRILDVSNCLSILSTTNIYDSLHLREIVKNYICKHFTEVSKSDDFLSLTNEDLMGWLKTENLVVNDENFVFERVIAWCMHDQPAREQHLQGLIEELNLSLVSSIVLADFTTNFPGIAGKSTIITEAIKQSDKQPDYSVYRVLRKYRYIHADVLVSLGGIDVDGDLVDIVEIYNTQTNSWFDFMSIGGELNKKIYFNAVVIKNSNQLNQMLIIGGRRNTEALNEVELLDFSTKTMKTVTCMNTPRVFPGAAVIETADNLFVFALGGCNDDHSSLRSVEKWDTRSDSWSYVAPMNKARKYFGVAVLKGKLYAAGKLMKSQTMEVYSMEDDAWTMCASMPSTHTHLLAGEDHLYALGGDCKDYSVNQYDPITDTWSRFATLPREWIDISACIYKREVIICGGQNPAVMFIPCDVKALDLNTRTWKSLRCAGMSRMNGIFLCLPYDHGMAYIEDESEFL